MEPWSRVLVLSLGGALGVNARYWLTVVMARWVDSRFPWATVAINVTGSFAIGVLAVVLAHQGSNPLYRLFFVTGFLGGYTTFSSFAYESLQLWEGGERRLSAWNAVGSVVAGLVAVALGVAVARAILDLHRPPDQAVGSAHHPGFESLPTDTILEGETEDS
jgi:CrcB protein